MFQVSSGAVAVTLLACLAGCASQGGAAPGNGTGGVPGAGGSAVIGSGGTTGAGGSLGSGGGPSIIIDEPGSGSGGDAPSLGTNGGYIDLTTAQVTDIKESQCAGETAPVDPVPAVLEFVVDVSQSMADDVNGETIPAGSDILSKWDITQPALAAALDALGDDVLVGMQFYPSNDGGFGPPGPEPVACVDDTTAYPIAALGAPGSAQRTTLATAIATTPLAMATPTQDAYVYALENGLGAYTGAGSRFMVLITDGAPSQEFGCGALNTDGVPTQPIIDAVAAANVDGVKTFVIGSPGSQAGGGNPPEDLRYWLSDAATAGGTAIEGCSSAGPNYCHLDMTTAPDFAAALSMALAEIGTAVVKTCSFTPPDASATLDLDSTTVILTRSDQTSILILPDADADCAQGGWARGTDGEIVLCPATCDMVNSDAGAELSMSVGCQIIIK